MFKIMKDETPKYLINLIPKYLQNARARSNHIPKYHCRKDCFKYSFFLPPKMIGFNLDDCIRHSESVRYSKIGYYHSFVLFKATCTISLT